MFVAALADSHQELSAPAGVLPWHQPHPCRQMPTVLELTAITNRSDHGRRGFGAHAANAVDTLTGRIGAENRFDPSTEESHALIHLAKKLEQFGNNLTRHCTETVGAICEDLGDRPACLVMETPIGMPRSSNRPPIWLTNAVR